MVDDVDVNESAHRMIEAALVESDLVLKHAKRLRALVRAIAVCQRAGAQLPADLASQLDVKLRSFSAALGEDLEIS